MPVDPAKKREYSRQWAKANREHVRAYRAENADTRNARRRQRYAEDPTHRAEIKSKVQEYQKRTRTHISRAAKRYKVDAYDLELMMNDGCAICRAHPEFDPKVKLHVDHDHSTGVVRGILCQSCNLALGHVHDDPIVVAAMFDYLTKPSRGSSGADSTRSRIL